MKLPTHRPQRFTRPQQKAVAANFLANPAGSTITSASDGVIVATQTGAGNAGNAGVISAFVSQNADAAVAQTLSAASLGVKNITGDASANCLAGGLGADKLYGADGDDVLLIDNRDTVVDGGASLDVAQVAGAANDNLWKQFAQTHLRITMHATTAEIGLLTVQLFNKTIRLDLHAERVNDF